MNTDVDYFSALLHTIKEAEAASALRLLADAADAHPADARPMLLLAAEFAQQQDMDRAEAAYIAALQRAPQFWIARFQLGLLQFTSARPAVAMMTWAPLDSLEEAHPLRLFKQAFEFLSQDQFDRARQFLDKGIAANTENLPLNRDMEKLIERIVNLQISKPEGTQGVDDTHFLVSAYKSLH